MSLEHTERVTRNLENVSANNDFKDASMCWFEESVRAEYSYNFSWLGRPLIQYPTDLVAMQEIIYETKPDLIIETGIAHGGSLIFHASMLALLDLCDADRTQGNKRQVIGIDVDIRSHNKSAIEDHPLYRNYISLFEGSSVSDSIIKKVRQIAQQHKRIMVVLDSNHTHSHVLTELQLYSELVTSGNYLIAMDTVIEVLPSDMFGDRPWAIGNNPMTAVEEFLESNTEFIIDDQIENKIMLTAAPKGYLRKISKLS
jgi:cephalosporin hydroxylase